MAGRSLVLALLALILLGCSEEEDAETRIRATLDRMEEAAEAGEPGNFLDYVAEDFVGQQGSFNRKRMGELLRIQLLRHTRVSATILSQEYQLFEGRAKGSMTLVLTGGPKNWLPERGRLYQVETSWIEREGDWLLLGSDWDTVAGTP